MFLKTQIILKLKDTSAKAFINPALSVHCTDKQMEPKKKLPCFFYYGLVTLYCHRQTNLVKLDEIFNRNMYMLFIKHNRYRKKYY